MLEVHGADGARSRHPFQPPRMRVGRREPSQLVLERDQAVSTEHCEFLEEDGWFVVRDLESANGTFVNGRRVGEARLRSGDEVRIGGTRIRVEVQGALKGRFDRRLRWLAAGAALLAAGALVGRAQLAGQDARQRQRYAAQLREIARQDPCAAADGALLQLAPLERQLAGRSVAIGLERGEVRISAADRRTDEELARLYRQKLEVYSKALVQLAFQQQKQREELEKAARLGQRLSSSKDRKMAAWAQAQLGERLAGSEELQLGLQELAAQTRRFAELVEAVALRGESAMAAELAHFRFTRDAASLARACAEGSARGSASALSALAALAED
jgi:hypothetical protein